MLSGVAVQVLSTSSVPLATSIVPTAFRAGQRRRAAAALRELAVPEIACVAV
jgi:hypothetical protein